MRFETVVNGRAAKLTIEGAHFRYEPEGGEVIEREFSLEPSPGSQPPPQAYSLLVSEAAGGRSFEVVPGNGNGTGNEIYVNGRVLSVEVFDPRSMRARRATGAAAGRQEIASSMPGKVVRVLVEAGDVVEAGQGLVVVEAMKMQNEMKSLKPGRVAEVRTRASAAVLAGQVLVVIE